MADEQDPDFDIEALQEQLASFPVEEFLVSAASTIASLAHTKLEREDLPQAKKAIDALAALAPLLEGELAADLGLALTRLQVAYAEAASA
ncbi:MAG: hypothetical protein ACJ757_04075 [Gaiellaceae bacterium]